MLGKTSLSTKKWLNWSIIFIIIGGFSLIHHEILLLSVQPEINPPSSNIIDFDNFLLLAPNETEGNDHGDQGDHGNQGSGNQGGPPFDIPNKPPIDPFQIGGKVNISEYIPQDIIDKNARDLFINKFPNNLEFQSTKKDSDPSNKKHDKWTAQISYGDSGLKIHIRYYENSNPNSKSISDLHFRLLEIIEYQDQNENGLYDDEISENLQSISLTNLALVNETVISTELEYELYYFEINSSDDIFSMRFYITEAFFMLPTTILSPAELKMDYIINNFPFSHPNSRLALNIQFLGPSQFNSRNNTRNEKNGLAKNESAFEFGDASNSSGFPFFSWEDFYWENNGTETILINSHNNSNPSESSRFFYINYGHSDFILHDPKLGFTNVLDFNIPSLIIDDPWLTPLKIGGLILFGVLILFGLMMTKQEFRDYLLRRNLPLHTRPHRLSMEEVLENETRSDIINLIIDLPGIHYSELLRRVDTSPSNLAWHLDILETYKIIHRQRVGNYIIFYPYLDENPFKNIDPTIAKSKTTLEIFKIIAENPDIYNKKIGTRLDLHRKTVAYHIGKLLKVNLIIKIKDGRKSTYHVHPEILDSQKYYHLHNKNS